MTNEALCEILGVDMETVEMLVDLFYEELEMDMAKLRSSIDASIYAQIQDDAHAIKGAASNMRFDDIADAARKIEDAAIAQLSDFGYNETYEELRLKVVR